jgi:hypothetical protein
MRFPNLKQLAVHVPDSPGTWTSYLDNVVAHGHRARIVISTFSAKAFGMYLPLYNLHHLDSLTHLVLHDVPLALGVSDLRYAKNMHTLWIRSPYIGSNGGSAMMPALTSLEVSVETCAPLDKWLPDAPKLKRLSIRTARSMNVRRIDFEKYHNLGFINLLGPKYFAMDGLPASIFGAFLTCVATQDRTWQQLCDRLFANKNLTSVGLGTDVCDVAYVKDHQPHGNYLHTFTTLTPTWTIKYPIALVAMRA